MLDFAELAPEKPRLLTRLEFERLADTGIFEEEERLELLRGVLVSPRFRPRDTTTSSKGSIAFWCSGWPIAREFVRD